MNDKLKKEREAEKHEHYWELVSTQMQATNWETEEKEYAYLVCKECGAVKKVEVK